ncbi:hypothetical protein [Halogranum amylolyticum]|nr:hypothetical protein [Halogranum amylolyticum]
MSQWYFRYTGDPQEKNQLTTEKKLMTTAANNNKTTYISYGSRSSKDINNLLGHVPDFRLGPVHTSMMPTFVDGPNPVQPNKGSIGGHATEVVVDKPIWLFGIWDYNNKAWEDI